MSDLEKKVIEAKCYDGIDERLLSNTLPDLLCKFRPINENTLSMFRTGNIFFARVSDLNDPMESFIHDSKTNKSYTYEKKAITQYERRAFSREIGNAGIYSASEYVHTKQYFAQWSHYGDQHRGLCIVFKPRENKILPWIKVNYGNGQNDDKFFPETPSWKSHSRTFLYDRLSWKHEDWKAEKEWRLILPRGYGGVQKRYNDFLKIHSIIFGKRTTEADIFKVVASFSEELVKQLSISV